MLVILHQVRSPDNLGAVARLLANFGVGPLVLSDPATHAFAAARKMAVGAESVLEHMSVTAGLREALAGATYACGTTSRQVEGRPTRTPEDALSRLAERAARGPVALVLGGEKRGLSDADLDLCQDVLVIPTRPEQPSMNLAQSAAVLLYLWSRATRPEAPAPLEAAAPLRAMAALEERMQEALDQVGYLNAQAPQHILRELMRSLERGGLSKREVELWLGAWDKVRRHR